MIHMVDAKNRALYFEQLAEMFRLRGAHFVKERGWDLKTFGDLEIDAYDDERTIYFLALDDDGKVGLSMRARPTDTGSMLADVFPHLMAPGERPIQTQGVWEISRIFSTRKFRNRVGLQRRAELFLAVVEAAHAAGIDRLVGLTDLYLWPQTAAAGWKVRPLGPPAAYGEGGAAIGVEVDSSSEGLAFMRESLRQKDRTLMYLSLDHPLAELGAVEAEPFYHLTFGDRMNQFALAEAVGRRVSGLHTRRDSDQLDHLVDRVYGLVQRNLAPPQVALAA